MKILLFVTFTNLVFFSVSQAKTGVHNWRLKNVVKLEQQFNNNIRNTQDERDSFLQRFASRFVKLAPVNSVGGTKEDYVNNPLPALVLIRRLVEDWVSLVSMLRGNHGFSKLGLGKLRWPSALNLESAAQTVVRAQSTYGLDTSKMANGMVTGKDVLFNVTAADCFYIANAYKRINFVDEALEWLNEASRKSETNGAMFPGQKMLQSLAHLRCYSGNTRRARLALIQLLENTPPLKVMEIGNNNWRSFQDCSELYYNLEESKIQNSYLQVGKKALERHKEMCSRKENLSGHLHCRYLHYHQPHLRFSPFKMEELQLDPPLLRFYDVITDNEGAILKEFGLNNMRASETLQTDGSLHTTSYRTSQVAWMYPKQHDFGDHLRRRIADLTQLNVDTAEALHISRYSISGEFLPHHDFLRGHGKPFLEDRIATLMFYLNDVKEGGNTIFTFWNLTVKPAKNSAILWFNHFPSGELDWKTMHSGCPVLEGIKWVLLLWIHNEGQEFKKRCGLTPDDSFRTHYLE